MASLSVEPPLGLVGRDRELGACEELLHRANRQGGALLLRGAPGIGKTSLLDAAGARAGAMGFRVLDAAGSEAEMAFPFAGLQLLLLPVIDADNEMPEHLRTALLSALGLVDAEIPALATVGLAVLGLLAGIATEMTPLCLVVDDVHWLDASSAEVLRFVSRRLTVDPIVLLAAGRDRGWPPAGVFPELRIEPLAAGAAQALLASQPSDLTSAARRLVLDQAEGNPLALVELAGALSVGGRSAERAASGILPLTARLEAAFVQRAALLPEDTRAVLLAAALAPTAVVAEVLAVAAALIERPVELSALDAAVVERLVDVDGRRIRFRHPLVRSGVVQGTTPSSRCAAHQALAGVLEDPQRSLHHRAEACVGCDNDLADELEAAAQGALRSGSLASAVIAFDQSAALTGPGPARGGRLVRAAALSFELGQADATRQFLARIDVGELAHADRTLMRRLALAVDRRDSDDPRAAWELIELAEEAVVADDNDAALQALEFASTLIPWGSLGSEVGRAIVATARKVPVPMADPRVIALLAHALPVEAHLELAARLSAVDEARMTDPESLRAVAFAAVIAGDYERSAQLLDRVEEQMREQARLAALATVLTFRGVAAFGCGEWRLADQVLDEAERLAADTDQAGWLNRARQMRAGVAGVSGNEELHRQIVDEQTMTYQRTNAHHRHNHLDYMQGITATMNGRPDDAIVLLSGLFEPADPIYDARTCFEALFFLADAAQVTGRTEEVRRALEVMSATVPAPWPPILQSAVDYAQAMTAAEPSAGERFEAALAGPAGGRAFDRARVQLAYGRWLRRHQHRLEAREQLRAARDIFVRLGNEPFAQRARDELRASGEASPRRRNADWDQLSAQEVQIARLVAQGLSNKKIGERMFLSPRTISSHLYRMFPKLGISSRAQLSAAVRSD